MNTKERIRYEALKLFSQKGYDAVGVTEIADAVGIKAPSLYKHYKSKRAIFDSIVQRMSEIDLENAREYEVPELPACEDNLSYSDVPFESVAEFTRVMFKHWTEDEFSSCFRRMLTLEQYKSDEMLSLYRQYISTGPLEYTSDIFRSAAESDEEAMRLALDFYGPVYLLYSVYDCAENKKAVFDLLDRHIESFKKRFNYKKEGKDNE